MVNQIKVSDRIALALKDLDIRHAFGIVGAGNVHLFESINRLGFTEIVCVHHEQAATMAIQTYYRTTNRLAVALLTTGAGSTNGITGVVSAWADSIPGLVIAGNENEKFCSPENPLRMWGVQGYDSVGMVDKVTKYSLRVDNPARVVLELEKAAQIAVVQRPGPVWVEIPMSIQASRLDYESFMRWTIKVSPRLTPSNAAIQRVVEALKVSKRPVLWLGHGVRLAGAIDKTKRLVDRLNIPVLLSWAGADMLDSCHPSVFGRPGVYGQRAANFILQSSDYVLSIGNRMAIPQIGYEPSELARSAKIDVVDIDVAEGNKLAERVNEFIHADACAFVDSLIELDLESIGQKKNWLEHCQNLKTKFPWVGPEHSDSGGYINSYKFMERLNAFFKSDQIIVTDMGTALLCAHQVLKFRGNQRLMTSTGLGEMGFGLPAAIGASFGNNKAEVICLNCDGGMMINIQELETIAYHNLPIKIFIFNNDGYLMIKHTQNSLFKGRGYVGTNKGSGVSCPDFSKIAKAFDIASYQIHSWDVCDQVISDVLTLQEPVLCEVFMNPEQLFVPKLSLASNPNGELVSPPLEDLSPLLPLAELEDAMLVGLHDKSRSVR